MSMSISQQLVTQKYGQDYLDGAKEGLASTDINGDGQTSVIEMYQNTCDVYSYVFEGNEEYSQRAQEIAMAQGEVYAKYAGDDGILDEYEYVEALNSDENNVLLEEYWELKDSMEAQNGEEEINGLSRHDTNNDGQTSVIEMFKDKIDLYSEIFKDDNESFKKAIDIALTQTEILSKYAGDDGVLSSEEYSQALRSESYGKTMDEYLEIKNVFSGLK